VVGRRSLLTVFAIVVALVLAAPAAASWRSDARAVTKGLTRAVQSGKLTRAEARGYRVELRRTRIVLRRLSWTNALNLGAVLHDTARQARRFNRPRARVLFSELRLNRRWLRAHAMPASGVDVFDSAGVLYRSFPGQGLRFHPLGNFAHLNGLVARSDVVAARRLGAALAARGVSAGRGKTVWEYTFPFGGGRPPWTSGMAQASAAQTLAWGADILGDRSLRSLARRAYRAIPRRLTLRLPAGLWVQHYSFSGLVVLNSQLQTALSIGDYARRTGDAKARRFAARLRASSARLLPSFDTGYWSLYSPRNESPLSYHLYVIQLLRKLWHRTGNELWRNTAATFHRYTMEPPFLRGGPSLKLLYPRPVDGFRDETTVSFWLSKKSTVTLRLPGLRRTMYLGKGRYRVTWRPTGVAPGRYRPRLTAFDLAGNKTLVRFDPITIAVDHEAPLVTARVRGRRLSWRAKDRATPWIRLSLRLDRPSRRRWIALGIRPHAGRLRLPRLHVRWEARLVVSDSSGNRTRADLGTVGGS
jgi:D-glucuronyl C5-epimerase C-terminus